MIADSLDSHTRRQLACMAKRHRVCGWHSMKKAELIDALRKVHRRRAADRADRKRRHCLAGSETSPERPRDRLHAEPRDRHWIHVRWEISRRAVRRAEAALKSAWHRSVPVLRLFDVACEETGQSVRRLADEIEIHAGTDHWYVPVADPERSFELAIGYRAPQGRFHCLARSRRVRMPRPGAAAVAEANGHSSLCSPGATNGKPSAGHDANPSFSGQRPEWEQRVLFERNGRRTRTARPAHRNGADGNGRAKSEDDRRNAAERDFEFALDAEVIVHGVTHPHAHTTLLGKRIAPDRDGSFSLRLSLPDGRQVIPAVAVTPDGSEQRTIVLSIDRNTRELEPLSLDEEAY